MATPPDALIDDALDRADAGLLARHLDARTCPPELLARLLRHPAPRLRHLGLLLLTERTATPAAAGGGADQQDVLARLLPASPGTSPEESLLLAELHARLGAQRPGHRLPDWRTAELPARVRIAWLRAELLGDPAAVRTEPPGELLYRAVGAIAAAVVHRPDRLDRLVAELIGSRDPVLGAEALRLAREGLHAGLLAPASARAHLIRLLDAPDGEVVTGALRELAEPWAAVTPLELLPLSRLVGGPGTPGRREGATAVADAALLAAARHGRQELLWRTAEDAASPPALRRRALELLGDSAERTDTGRLLAVAAPDPLLLAGPVLAALLGLHRRGHFPTGPDVRPLLALALGDHTLPADDVATVLYTCRRYLFDALVDAPPTAPDWPRRLELLVALAGQGATDVPIGEAVTRLLPTAPAARPFLDAIRALRPPDAEEAVLALLPRAPGAALAALEAVGGARTREALAQGLGVADPTAVPGAAPAGAPAPAIAPELRPVRDRALELLWHLTDEPVQRRRLLSRLDPKDLPGAVEADLGAPDERELAVLRSRVDVDDPVGALCRIAGNAGRRTPPLVADLILRIVRDLAAPREPGPEPELPQEALSAVRALGRRLRGRARIRPVCLLGTTDGTAAGHALLSTTLLDLLERPGLSGGEQAVLLKALTQTTATPATRARVHRLLRSRDPQVRKHVIALLAHDTSGRDARALSATLVPLTADPDIRTVRQALLALGAARAFWAGEAVAACLDHPNMNVRKTAAATLVHAGAPASVPRILGRLGRDDNPGLRAALTRALRAVVGPAYAATLLAAAEAGQEARGRRLLLSALDGELTARAVLAFDAQASPVVPLLLTLVADGGVRLADGSVEDLAEPLARHGVPAPPVAPNPSPCVPDPEVAALLRSGWDPALALRIARRATPPDLTDVTAAALREHPRARAQLEKWLVLAESTREAGLPSRLLRCALRLCPAPWSADETALLARYAGTVADAFDEATGVGEASFAGELTGVLHAVAPELSGVQRFMVVEGLRTLPPGAGEAPDGYGPPALAAAATLTLLRELGAVLVRADLDRALDSAHLGADPWQAAPAVLGEAFGVAGPREVSGAAPEEDAGGGVSEAWRAELREAVRTPGALAELRGRGTSGAAGSRDLLAALVTAYPAAGPDVRGPLVDWMAELQPLDAPPWNVAETRTVVRAAAAPPRPVRADDLDQPRSAAQRARLLAMLEAPEPERRNTAVRALRTWPEPEVSLALLRAFLHGRVDLLPADLIGPAARAGQTRLAGQTADQVLAAEGVLPERALRWTGLLPEDDLPPLVPLLLKWWEHGPPAVREAARTA
ncbi:HEAT repeat domain-containing protein [Streptomyces sp. WZ.A104]|uniref:HEAT repeat domain-containing protein n=1 Tax=Streptomyces sp. WZ.A104 TaxID=2023771 RepID=UPI00211C8FCC|nr:HEAT repeat domain-containing protein [Streptomyces sp. WZ.A104]